MQASRLGGSIDSEETAVAVMPSGRPCTLMLITFTVAATRRIALRNCSMTRSSSPVIPPASS
jgi:hypothetical protein